MSLQITGVQTVDSEEWQKSWSECEWATFFESPEWHQIWIKWYNPNFRSLALTFSFSDGNSCVVPCMQGFRLKKLISHLEISPGGTYGGPLSQKPLDSDHIRLIAEYLQKKGNYYWRVNPYCSKNLQLLQDKNSDKTYINTQSVNLKTDKLSFEKLLQSNRITPYARKAKELGYTLRPLQMTQIDAFFEVYTEAQSRWDEVSIPYDVEIFRLLLSCKSCDFWVVVNNSDEIVGGGPILKCKSHAVAWLPIMQSKALKHRVYEMFYYELLWHYRDAGLTWFDFNPSGGNEGVWRFKSKFKPEVLPTPVFAKKSAILKLIDGLVR